MNNPLTDLIPARYRKYLYALAFVVSIVWGVYEAQGQDWRATVGALVALVLSALAHSNTPAPTPKAAKKQGGYAHTDALLGLAVVLLIGAMTGMLLVHYLLT